MELSTFICVYGFLYVYLCLWLYEIGVVKGEVDAVAIVADALGNDVQSGKQDSTRRRIDLESIQV